ncbi:MAG TPA: PEP-utilizing enzyme, partial [Longimicrobium sp.]|nr:PEP-utilizing enzyme [Longimicrobium sp.]
MFQEPESRTAHRKVHGLAVGSGVYEGTARVVLHPSELGRIRQGDVLVTGATTAAFNLALPLLGALVTDRGGMLCHAAIVARECGIPAVVGSSDATRVIPDGSRVRVDGATGLVQVLG